MADPHSAFGGSRLGSENPKKTLAKNNKEVQNKFRDKEGLRFIQKLSQISSFKLHNVIIVIMSFIFHDYERRRI